MIGKVHSVMKELSGGARERLTPNDRERSWTSGALPMVVDVLRSTVNGDRPRALLDVGCGYGGIAATLRDALGVDRAHGVDIDEAVLAEATSKGVHAQRVDVATEALPYADGRFDVVTCFGMLDYLPWYDVAVAEISRVLTADGVVAIALPNLASWHNRIALLFGYQPRDVEFCSRRAVGLAPFYGSDDPVGHLHTPTVRAFREFMALLGFTEEDTVALHRHNPAPRVLQAADRVLGRFPSLSRRFLYVGRKTGEPEVGSGGWWSRPA